MHHTTKRNVYHITYVLNQILNAALDAPGQEAQIGFTTIGTVSLDTPDDAAQEAVDVLDAADIGLRQALHHADGFILTKGYRDTYQVP
jgi:hypothetical protein